MAALDRALALAEREHAAGAVGEHLLLDVEAAVAERREGLVRRGDERTVDLLRGRDEPHPLAAAARARLQEHRVAELAGDDARLRELRRVVGSRHERHARSRELRL